MTMTKRAEPTKQQLALAAFADAAERSGIKTSLYWRLMPQIMEARAAIQDAKREESDE